MLVKIPLYASSFWLKISKKPQLYKNTASFFKNFYLKNILHKVSLFSENATDEMDFYQIKLEYQRIFDFIDNGTVASLICFNFLLVLRRNFGYF